MKNLLFFLLMIAANPAQCKEVTVTGFGTTYDLAMKNAKLIATEQQGVFIHNTQTYNEHGFTDETKQFTGGTIKSYKVKNVEFKDGFHITIEADVDKKDNNVSVSSPVEFDAKPFLEAKRKLDEQNDFLQNLDDPEKAFDIKITKVESGRSSRGNMLVISFDAKLQRKWIDDMKSIGRMIKNQNSNTMYCFDTAPYMYSSACYDVDYPISKLMGARGYIVAVDKSGSIISRKHVSLEKFFIGLSMNHQFLNVQLKKNGVYIQSKLTHSGKEFMMFDDGQLSRIDKFKFIF